MTDLILDLKGRNKLLGDENIITIAVQGNHFPVMREPDVSEQRNC